MIIQTGVHTFCLHAKNNFVCKLTHHVKKQFCVQMGMKTTSLFTHSRRDLMQNDSAADKSCCLC